MTTVPWYLAALAAALVWGIHYPLVDQALKKLSLPGVLVTMTGAYRPRGAAEHAVLREPAATTPDGPTSI